MFRRTGESYLRKAALTAALTAGLVVSTPPFVEYDMARQNPQKPPMADTTNPGSPQGIDNPLPEIFKRLEGKAGDTLYFTNACDNPSDPGRMVIRLKYARESNFLEVSVRNIYKGDEKSFGFKDQNVLGKLFIENDEYFFKDFHVFGSDPWATGVDLDNYTGLKSPKPTGGPGQPVDPAVRKEFAGYARCIATGLLQ